MHHVHSVPGLAETVTETMQVDRIAAKTVGRIKRREVEEV
jgi:hypothetical protein